MPFDPTAQFDVESTAPNVQQFDPSAQFDIEGNQTDQQQKPFTIMDTWPVQLAKSIYSAVTLPGDVYSGKASVPQSENMPGGEDTSSLGRVATLAGISPVSQMGAMRVTPPTTSQLRASSAANYKSALNLPIELKPSSVGDFSTALQSELSTDGFNDVTAPKTFAILDMLNKAPNGSTVTPQNLRTVQRTLGVVKDKNADPTERMVAGMALDHFNNFLENLNPEDLTKGTPDQAAQFSSLVKNANGDYRAYKQSNAFDFRGEVAQNNSHAANSGMNLENNLRTQARQILNNPKLQRGYDDQTLQALRDFNNGSRTANTVRLIGNMLGGGGGWGMLASGTIGHLMGLPVEALPAAGLALKQIGNQRATNQFSNIGEMIRANSPLAKSGVTSLASRSPVGVGSVTSGQRVLPQLGSLNLAYPFNALVPAPAENQQ